MALGRFALAVPVSLVLAGGAPVSGETIAIVGGTLIDGTGRRPIADAVVVVNDGSKDNTAKISKLAGAQVVEHGNNRGAY